MNKKITSIVEAAALLAEDPKAGEEVAQEIKRSRLVTALIALRMRQNMTQKQIADAMGCDPSKISKIESGNDQSLRWGDIQGYIKALGADMSLVIEDSSLPAAARIKQCVMRIHELLQDLAKISAQVRGEKDITDKIHQFYGEVLLNFVLRFDSSYKDFLSVIRVSDTEREPLVSENLAGASKKDSAENRRGSLVEAR